MNKDEDEEGLWYVNVPVGAKNITFNRFDSTGEVQWNSWSAGGRGTNNVYSMDGAEYGHWYYEDDTQVFEAGDIVYLDLRSFKNWKKDDAIFYIEFNNANVYKLDYEVTEDVYAYIITKNDEGTKKLSFYRGNETEKWNTSIKMSAKDYGNDLNCVEVKGWNKKGNLTKYDGSIDYYKDTDGDGLSDYSEAIHGTDKDNCDTDEDGLSDYEELIYVESDPLVYDSLEEGIADGDVDIDNDGLTNIEEVENSSNPKKVDTDNDGLNDFEEIKIFSTNPKKADTDNDRLPDVEEIDLSTNPNAADSDDSGIVDGDEYFSQRVTDDLYEEGLNDENIAQLDSLTVYARGSIKRHIKVSEYKGDMLGDTSAFVGKVIEIADSDIHGGDIKFRLDEAYEVKNYLIEGVKTNGLLICYNNGEETVPLETTYDIETRTLNANVEGAGVYFVFDTIRFMEVMGMTSFNISEAKANTSSYNATQDLAANLDDIDLDSDDNNRINAQADIVFVIDTTGSMGRAVNNVKNNILKFVDELKDENIVANYALVDYRDITCDGKNYTNVRKNGIFNFYSNPTMFKNAISSLSVRGGGDTPETAIDGLEMARRLDFRKNAQKFVILVTDAGYKVDNNYGIASMDEMTGLFKEDDINVSVISDSRYKGEYNGLYSQTGGIFANINGNFSAQLSAIADMIKNKTNDGYWVALNGLTPMIVKLEEKPAAESTVDTDKDGVYDIDELKTINPAKQWKINDYLKMLGLPEDLTDEYIPMYDYNSNPTVTNTDNDGLDDYLDNEPRNPKVHSFVIYETERCDTDLIEIKNSSLRTGKDDLIIHEQKQNDFKYADKTKDELCDMDQINRNDFNCSKDMYEYSFKDLVAMFLAGDMQDVGISMVDQLCDGTGDDFTSDTLNEEVKNHENTTKYDNDVKECIDELLSQNGGDMKQLKYDKADRDSSALVNAMQSKNVAMPYYNDKFEGLGVCVDGFYGSKIEVTSFSNEDGVCSYTLHYTMYDIYGLDEADITDSAAYVPSGFLHGFRAWYILQHYDILDGDIKPFITYTEFDK